MKYVCLGLYDEAAFAQMSQADSQKMFEECFAYDDVLRRGGHFLGGEALDSARNAVTLRMKDGEVQVTDGPFVETKETLGGILLLEARDLNHAIEVDRLHRPDFRVAATPSVAVSTSRPASSSRNRSSEACVGLSSTTSTRVMCKPPL